MDDKLSHNKTFSQQKIQVLLEKIEKVKDDVKLVHEHK